MQNYKSNYHAFTTKYKDKVNQLITNVAVSKPILLNSKNINEFERFFGIWDTGATTSCVSGILVKKLDLQPIGIKPINTANGSSNRNTYLVNIALPNNVIIPNVEVIECDIIKGVDLLIGMDIINLGDFTITTTKEGLTVLSFCIPSIREIDFVEKINSKRINDRKSKSPRIRKKRKKKK